MHEALAGPCSGSQGVKLDDARIRGEELPERAVHDGRSGVQGELSEHGLSLRLETVDMGRVRIVQLEAECRKLRIADDDLEILVVVVEARRSGVRRCPSKPVAFQPIS